MNNDVNNGGENKILQTLTERFHWRNIKQNEHFVQFYEDEYSLQNSLINYIGKGIGKGDVCVVIATKKHRDLLENKLQELGLNISVMKQNKTYYSLDAEEILGNFMINNMPDSKKFEKIMEGLMSEIDPSRHTVRAFGEMVALLWDKGNYKAAIQLEKLWNELGDIYTFSLFCAYPLDSIKRKDEGSSLKDICNIHTKLIHSKRKENDNSGGHLHEIFITKKRAFTDESPAI